MGRVVLAVVIAIGSHALLALGLAAYMRFSPARAISAAELDLSSVELSLSEREVEAPPVAQLQALPPSPPPEEMREPEPVSLPDPVGFVPTLVVPPEAAAIALPEPDPEAEVPLDLPPVEVEPVREDPPEEDPPAEKPVEEKPEEQPEAQKPEPKARPSAVSESAAPVPAPQQARVDVPPQPRRTIKPKYPEESRQRGEEGDVQVEIDVTARGSVAAVRVLRSSGFAALDAAAQKAVRQARFTPAKSDGKAMPATARLTLTFRLRR